MKQVPVPVFDVPVYDFLVSIWYFGINCVLLHSKKKGYIWIINIIFLALTVCVR